MKSPVHSNTTPGHIPDFEHFNVILESLRIRIYIQVSSHRLDCNATRMIRSIQMIVPTKDSRNSANKTELDAYKRKYFVWESQSAGNQVQMHI